MKRILSSLAPTIPLFVVAFTCFVWGNNAHMYAPDCLAVSFLVLAVFAAIACGIGSGLRFFWEKSKLDRYWLARLALGAALGVFLVYLVNILFRGVLRDMLPEDFARHIFRGGLVVAMIALALFRLRGLVRFLNLFLLASICLSAAMAASAFLNEPDEDATGGNMAVALKKTPNIYLFFMESFHEPRVIDKYYGTTLVRDGCIADLEERGFQHFGNTYANSNSTLLSMADTFSMSLSMNREAGMNDARRNVRTMLGGSDENRVLKILKNNGYFTAVLADGNSYYHGGNVGANLDSTDYVVAADSFDYYLRPLEELSTTRMRRWFGSLLDETVHDADGGYSGTMRERVRHAMDLAKNAGKPLFVSFKRGAGHTGGAEAWRKRAEWVPEYRRLAAKGLVEAMDIIDMILADDPEAVIIVMGDHGAWRLRGIYDGVKSGDVQALSEKLEGIGESLESLADDLFNVILAIRIPGREGDISRGLPMSPVNVFRHVFSALNDDPALLDDRWPNKTMTLVAGLTLVEEGNIIRKEEGGNTGAAADE